jgi:isocitrate dehydrogenase
MNTIEQGKAKQTRQYDLLAHKFNELYLTGKERGHDAMDAAIEKAHEQLTTLDEFSQQQGEDLKRYLVRDLQQRKVAKESFTDKTVKKCKPSRLGAGALVSLVSVLDATSNSLRSVSSKTSAILAYHTGEITSAGTLTCKKCGQTMQFNSTGHVPPCPNCNATQFSKGY